MDSGSIDILQWNAADMIYRCQFGEVSLFKLKLSGLKSAPNIFEVDAQIPAPAPSQEKVVSHAYSLPCDETLQPGVSLENGYIHHVFSVYKHYFVDTSLSFEEYMTRFKGKTLNNLKRKIKKVEKSNSDQVTFQTFSKLDDVGEFLTIAKSISAQSYQEKLLGRELPTTPEFKEKLVEMAKSEKFRGYILYAEDTPIAYNLCPIYGNGIMLYDFTGYDPRYSRYSAGTVLQYNIIKQCFEDPAINTYDLCSGEGQHKAFFATGYKTCCDVFYFPKTPFYLLTVYLKYFIEKLSRKIINTLDKIGIKSQIKKFIRRFK